MRPHAQSGWLLFDGDCGVCIRWAQLWAPVLRRRGFEIDRLQAEWVSGALGMTQEDVVRDIRLLTTGGNSFAGADVYLYAARQIWWMWPLGVIFGLPGLRSLLWAGYRWVSRNRHCISGVCRLT